MKRIITAVLFMLFLACVSINAKIKVFTSIQPLAYLIENIGGDNIEVSVMLREGDNPHTFEPLPSQITALSNADMYIKLGSGIEFESIWFERISNANSNMRVADASKGIKLLKMHGHKREHHSHDKKKSQKHHSENDPHIWLSVSNAVLISANIRDALIEIDAQNAGVYSENARKLIDELAALKKETEEKLKNIKTRSFLIFHPSFGYFAHEFKLKQIAVEFEGKEPSPKQLKNIIETAKKNKISAVFASENFSQKSAEIISKEIKGRVILLNELSKDYLNNLRKIAAVFQEELK